MDLLMNGLLMAASLFSGGYCWVLARRVQDLKALDKGLGGSIVTLTRQVELARTTLDEARASSRDTRHDLAQLVAKAEGAAGQLKLLLAATPLLAAAPAAPPAPPVSMGPAPAVPPGPKVSAPASLATIHPLPEPLPEPLLAPAPRPVTPHLVEVPPPVVEAAGLPEVPKPRALAPLENPLRRARPVPAAARSEDELIEALSAIAGGR